MYRCERVIDHYTPRAKTWLWRKRERERETRFLEIYKRKKQFFFFLRSQVEWFYDDNTILISFIACIICSSWSFRLFSQFTMSLTFYFKYLLDCLYSLQEANWYNKKKEEGIQGFPKYSNGKEKRKIRL